MTDETTEQTPAEEVQQTPQADGEQASAAQSQEGQEPEAGADEQGKKGRVYTDEELSQIAKRRIDVLTKRNAQAEAKLNEAIVERLRAEEVARQLWQQQQELQRQVTMPRVDQFQDVASFERAVQEHAQRYVQQEREVAQQYLARTQQAVAQAEAARQQEARVAEARAKFADYDEVVMTNPKLPRLDMVNPAVLNAIMQSEHMPELTYYLGKNPDVAHALAAMAPMKAILEAGRLSAEVGRKYARQTTNAPAPPPTVGGNQRASDAPSDHDSPEEWLRKRRAQLRKRYG